MKFNINFGKSDITLPEKVCEHLARAGGIDVKVLIAFCSISESAVDTSDEKVLATVVDMCACSEAEVGEAISFWRGAGLFDVVRTRWSAKKAVSDNKDAKAEESGLHNVDKSNDTPVASKIIARQDELPRYTTDELAALLEERSDTAAFIDECQRVWGKMFNTHEINILLGLSDYLGLDWEYILILLAYCKKTQESKGMKKSMHYVEKVAFGLYDEGVQDVAALDEKIQRLEMMAEAEGQLRTLFGMGARALTPKEKKCFSTWLYEYNYGLDIIKLAYDITVDAKGTPNISYLNSVLANWNSADLHTVVDIEKAQKKFKEARNPQSRANDATSGSFDTEDFFAAALRRSFGEDFDTDANK